MVSGNDQFLDRLMAISTSVPTLWALTKNPFRKLEAADQMPCDEVADLLVFLLCFSLSSLI